MDVVEEKTGSLGNIGFTFGLLVDQCRCGGRRLPHQSVLTVFTLPTLTRWPCLAVIFFPKICKSYKSQ